MKKHNYSFIKEQFEKEGCVLLSNSYINNSQKLEYICSKGHKHSIRWSNWAAGKRCPYCAGQGKPTIEFIRRTFIKEGYNLLTTKYVNNRQKLNYICPNGHRHSINWGNWVNGNRCPYCVGQGKPTIEYVLSEFEKAGYKLLTTKYINAHTKLNYICPEGHEHQISWSEWYNLSNRCPTCAVVNRSGKNSYNWKGGISCEPYCDIWLDKEFKESILERDDYQCQNPDCWGTSKRLTIHHIDYVKKHCDPWNLITLCNSCNVRANYDREWYKMFYRVIVERKNKIKKFVVGL